MVPNWNEGFAPRPSPEFKDATFQCEIVLDRKIYLVFRVVAELSRVRELSRKNTITINGRDYIFQDSIRHGEPDTRSSDCEYQIFVQPVGTS